MAPGNPPPHQEAQWAVARSGVINLKHPRARAAGLDDGLERIAIYAYAITHPDFGLFLIDSGVSRRLADTGAQTDISWLLRTVMHTADIEVLVTTAEILASYDRPLVGVFMTHLHLDHIFGFADIPSTTPVYVGRGEMTARSVRHLATRATKNHLLQTVEH